MATGFAKDAVEDAARAIDDHGLLRETRSAGDETRDAQDLLDAIEAAEGKFEHGQRVQCADACRLDAFLPAESPPGRGADAAVLQKMNQFAQPLVVTAVRNGALETPLDAAANRAAPQAVLVALGVGR